MSQYDCICFDLDDTLWACAPVIERAERLFYQWLQQHHPRVTACFSPSELVRHRIEHFSRTPELQHHMTLMRKHWLDELVALCAADATLVDEGFQVFWLARNEVALFEGAEALLLDLKSRYTVCSMTNGNADVRHMGLGHLFDFSLTSMEAGVAKPHRDIFHLAAARAAIPIERVLHVGDDWLRDVQGALRAGAAAAWVQPARVDLQSVWQADDRLPNYSVDTVLALRQCLLPSTAD